MEELKAFATDSARILEAKKGELTGMGGVDAILVLDPYVSGLQKLGEGPCRSVLLLVRDDDGGLRLARTNQRIVPNASCGGVAGDPFGYVSLEMGGFTIVNGGGSRERWSDEYTFVYAPERADWFVSKVTRQVSDSETGLEKRIDLTPVEFGAVAFHDFDPADIPEVHLP